MTEQRAGRDEVEVAHEALIRHWPRLRAWLDQDRAALLLRETIREAAQEWERHGHDESYLAHRGRRLAEAEALAHYPRFTLNAQEQAYLDAAVALREQEAQEREAQRQRELEAQRERAELAEAARHEAEQRVAEQALAAGKLRRRFLVAAGLGALAVLAALYAFYNFQEAGQQRVVAVDAQGRAEAQAARAATEAARADAEAKAAQSAESEAQEQASAAETAEAEAVVAAARAEAETARAENEAARAATEATRAENEARVALSRQLAAQSRALAGDLDLGLLLAAEAYDLNPGDLEVRGSLLAATHAQPRLEKVSRGHLGAIQAVVYSPDGTTVASGGTDGTIRLWDPISGEAIGKPITTGNTAVWDVAFSPDGLQLAVANLNGIQLLDPTNGAPVGAKIVRGLGGSSGRWHSARTATHSHPADLTEQLSCGIRRQARHADRP